MIAIAWAQDTIRYHILINLFLRFDKFDWKKALHFI